MSLKIFISRFITRRYKHYNAAAAFIIKQGDEKYYRNYENGKCFNKKWPTIFLGSILVGSVANEKLENHEDNNGTFEAGTKRQDLPTFRAEEISKHDDKHTNCSKLLKTMSTSNPHKHFLSNCVVNTWNKLPEHVISAETVNQFKNRLDKYTVELTSFWVTYKHGVYDVTSFLSSHPGGDQILNAGGHSIEPFWNVYGMHKTEEVFKLLETYRIGNLHDDDYFESSDDELWAREPYRDKRLLVKTLKPFNAEVPPKLQIQSLDTPNELFYVRQHMPVPELDADSHKINIIIKGAKARTVNFTLNEIMKIFPRVSVRAALMCAGNRRSEMNKVKPVKGLSWTTGAISNAVWSGVYLRDVLLYCGLNPNDVEGKHITFTGSDIDATGENFSTSLPLYMAFDPSMKILLATHMNGEPLPPDHGYPLRVVVPGAPAVRSVKWLESITISDEESSSHWHQKDYRSFNPSKTWETADFSTAPPIYTLPVTSAICDPQDGETVPVVDGHVIIKGYAYSGGGAKVVRVDVSGDRGRGWVQAAAAAEDAAPPRAHYAWLLWRARLPAPPAGAGEMHIWVKATDSNFNTQPENFNDIWNIRGLLSNAYHKITINVTHTSS